MVNQSVVELRALVQHRTQILLTQQGKVDSLEELLSGRINGDTLLELAKVGHVLLDDCVRGLD